MHLLSRPSDFFLHAGPSKVLKMSVFSSQMLGIFSLYVWFLIWMNVVGVDFITGCKTCIVDKPARKG